MQMFDMWEGVYGTFSEAPVSGPGFGGERWRQASLDLAKETIAKESLGEAVDFSLGQRNAVLPVVVASLRRANGAARILDIGGGLGTGFTVLRAGLMRQMHGISYDILEIPEVCRLGENLSGSDELRFVRDFPGEVGSYDIVYLASTLQYIDDWRGFLTRIIELEPKYILLSDIFAGNIRSYVTLQNYYESKIAFWFLNEDELLSTFDAASFEVILKMPSVPRILGKVGPLPMSNLPMDRRIEHAWHYLLCKKQAQ